MNNFTTLIKFLDKHSFATREESAALGVSDMMLSRLVTRGELHRVEAGIYARELAWLTDPLQKYIVACTRYPDAVICGVSALTYYDLTDEEERKTWIALPAPKTIHHPRYRVIRTTGLAYTLGVAKRRFGKRHVRVYDLEKTVVDAFKYLTEEVAFKALKGYFKRKDRNVTRLCDYARRLRKPLDKAVTLLLSDE